MKLYDLYKEFEHAFETKSTIILTDEDWNELKPILQKEIVLQQQSENVRRFTQNRKPLKIPRFK